MSRGGSQCRKAPTSSLMVLCRINLQARRLTFAEVECEFIERNGQAEAPGLDVGFLQRPVGEEAFRTLAFRTFTDRPRFERCEGISYVKRASSQPFHVCTDIAIERNCAHRQSIGARCAKPEHPTFRWEYYMRATVLICTEAKGHRLHVDVLRESSADERPRSHEQSAVTFVMKTLGPTNLVLAQGDHCLSEAPRILEIGRARIGHVDFTRIDLDGRHALSRLIRNKVTRPFARKTSARTYQTP